MEHVSLSQKHGVFKPSKAKEQQKLKQSARYFNLKIPNTDSDDFPRSCSEFIQGKKKKGKKTQFDGDMTSQLLKLVSQTATNVPDLKQLPFTCNDGKENDNIKCDLKNNMSTETSLSVNNPVVDPSEEIKKTCIVDGVAGNPCNDNKSNHFDTNSTKKSKKDIKKDNKNKNKIDKATLSSKVHVSKSKKVKSFAEKVNEQQNTGKSNGKRFKLKNSIDKQENAFLNDSDSLQNTQSFKDFEPEIYCQIAQHKSGVNGEETDIKFMTTSTKEHLAFSAQEEKKMSTHAVISKTKQKSNTQNFSAKCNSEIIKKEIGMSASLKTLKKQNKKTSKINDLLDDGNPLDCHEISGGWDVIDSDNVVENTTPLKRVRKSAKKKIKNSKILNVHAFNKLSQKHEVKVPKKPMKKGINSSNQEFGKSQPILVEMSGNNEVPFSPFHTKVKKSLKRKNNGSSVNCKSDLKWKACNNLHGTDKWKVQYGNNIQLTNVEKQLSQTKQQQLSNVEDFVAINRGNESEIDTIEKLEKKQNPISPTNSTESTEETIVMSDSCEPYQLFSISGTTVVLALPPSSSVFFQGAVKVKVLLGNISVLGLEISHTNPQEYTVYSPRGVSLLGFQSCVNLDTFSSDEEYWELVREKIGKSYEKTLDQVLQSVAPFSSLLLLQSVSETLISFLLKYFPSFNYFPSALSRSRFGEDSSGILRALFVDPKSTEHNFYKQPSAWNSVTSLLIKQNPGDMRVLALGGKGVGKSTFLRFLVNQTLSQFKEILYIDFDIGQCEFSIPGCVSASIVKNPLLGPNFTHLPHPERLIYIGEINVSFCVDHYIQSIRNILDWCHSQPHLSKMPWFINTMGFVQGLGLELAVSIIKMVNPSDVIQIQSSQEKCNFPFSLNFEKVQNHATSLRAIVRCQTRSLRPFSFHELPSASETPDDQKTSWTLPSKFARETVIISYFSKVVSPPAFSLLEVTPHVLSFSRLKLCVTNKKVKYSEYLSAMNANLVALCKVQDGNSLIPSDPEYPEILEKAPICHCFGFGIVRGVDIEKKQVFVISPLQPKKMNFVNCLLLGAINLPERILTSQDEARGTIPYVVEGALLPLAKGVQHTMQFPKLES